MAGEPGVPDGDGGEGLLVDICQLLHDNSGRGEDAVGVQEGVEEVDGKEAQVCQPLQQPLHAGIADLRNLAGVERLAEANVNIVFMETSIGSNEEHKRWLNWHGAGPRRLRVSRQHVNIQGLV